MFGCASAVYQLEALLNDLQCSNFIFSVICLQETWLSADFPTADISNLPGYQTVSFGSSVGSHGGLTIYIRYELKFKVKKKKKKKKHDNITF